MATVKTTVIFDEILKSDELGKRIVIAQGGARSGKTFNILIYWIYRLLQENGKTLSIVRKSLPSLKNSVLKDLFEVLELFGVYDPANLHKQDGWYRLGNNVINWFSVDEPQKLRGSKRNYLYCNEANELRIEDWNQLIFRTSDKVILDFNPSEINSWVYDLEKREDSFFFQSTWRDNPFIEKSIVDELEALKDKDDNLYRVYALGERGTPQQLVFNKFYQIDKVPPSSKLLARGIDWGFNSPTALVEVYKEDDNLYINEKLYVRGMTVPDIISRMETFKIDKTDTIWADSALPQNIEELRRSRWNVKPVKKKPIMHGLDLIRRHKIYITKNSHNIINEFSTYKYKEDKDGQLLDVPEDENNHAIDALRYVLESELTKRTGKITIL